MSRHSMLLGTKQKLAVGKILCRKDITVEIRDNEVPRLQNSRDSEIFLYPRRMPVGFNAFCAACEQNVTELQSCINEICWNVTPHVTYSLTAGRLKNVLKSLCFAFKLSKIPPHYACMDATIFIYKDNQAHEAIAWVGNTSWPRSCLLVARLKCLGCMSLPICVTMAFAYLAQCIVCGSLRKVHQEQRNPHTADADCLWRLRWRPQHGLPRIRLLLSDSPRLRIPSFKYAGFGTTQLASHACIYELCRRK